MPSPGETKLIRSDANANRRNFDVFCDPSLIVQIDKGEEGWFAGSYRSKALKIRDVCRTLAVTYLAPILYPVGAPIRQHIECSPHRPMILFQSETYM